MKELQPIDATPQKRMYSSIIADYDVGMALCELVDNVIDNGKKNGLPTVLVEVNMNLSNQTIEVKDTSGGVEELKNLVSPGATGNGKSEKELIGLFGVGTKRATIALAKNICIRTRIKGDHTKIIIIDQFWIDDNENWSIAPFIADQEHEEIDESATLIELTNLRKPFEQGLIKNIYDHFSETYAFFIKEGSLEIKLNGVPVKSKFFEKWSYSPIYPPTRYWGFIEDENNINKKIRVEILAGLSNVSNPSGDWGVYFYCNNRLIEKDIKNQEVGFGKGFAGNPHPAISLLNIIVFLKGESNSMPWNSSKSGINYSHVIFKKIQKQIQNLVITYAKISRALEGNWEEKLFQFSSGQILDKPIVFERFSNRDLPPLPPSKTRDIEKIRDSNENIFDSKPWTKGIFGGIEAKEIILRRDFYERNRFLLIILDSTLEIAFKEFLVNDANGSYSDTRLLTLFADRTQVHSEVEKYNKGRLISKKEWKLIKYYYKMRCQLIHQRTSVPISDKDIEIFSDTVKSVLRKLFNFNFDIKKNEQ